MPPRRGGAAADAGDEDDVPFPWPDINPGHARLVFQNLARVQPQWKMRILHMALERWYRTCMGRTLIVRQGMLDEGVLPSGASGAGERKEDKSSVSTTTSTFDGSPNEKSLSGFLSDGHRISVEQT